MFGDESLMSIRETAAVLALLARHRLPWNRIAGSIEESGSALQLLDDLERTPPDQQLFEVERKAITLDELEERVHGWHGEGFRLVTVLDAAYPVNLRMVHDRPAVLFVRGELENADRRSVAIVGTRRVTPAGREKALAIARALVAADYVVVSGLAAGVDTVAHSAALDAGGRTVAVIGTGLRHHFPRENEALQRQIGDEHAVISQFWPGQPPRKWTFPQRNAVMSGFARATVVVEASHTSGARMQARLATEHGRPVFLLQSLVEQHKWAQGYVGRPGVYVVEEPEQIVEHLERLYSDRMTLIR